MSKLLNDQSENAPALKIYLNTGNLEDLPEDSLLGGLSEDARWNRLAEDGFDGIQFNHSNPVPEGFRFPYCGSDRVNTPEEADAIFRQHKELGDDALTLHVGWGMEDDDAVDQLVEAVLLASDKYHLPAYIETHRATITQDIWRTVKLTERFPEVRFNGDFSHYYCGLEMVYGDFEKKLAFMEPIFSRTGFMHGRIASSGCMQVPIDDAKSRPRLVLGDNDYLEHFRMLWTAAMRGFLGIAGKGDYLVFAPELLRADINYARVFPNQDGILVEESDRYEQAMLYMQVARDCFESAKKHLLLKISMC